MTAKRVSHVWMKGAHGIAMAVALAFAPGAVVAQDDDGADAVEEIVVTGSRLPRRDLTAPSPITTIDRDDILSSGQPTLEGTLNRLPQVQPGLGRASTTAATGRAATAARGRRAA